jgi:hypothetical protein
VAADTTETERPAPRVIRVLPPDGLTVEPNLIVTATLGLLFLGLIALCLGLTLVTGVALVGAAALGGAVWLGCWWPRHRQKRERRRQAYLAKLRECSADALAVAIAECWRTWRGVSDDDVKAALAASAPSDPPRALVVSLGKLDVPEVGAVFFEPEIITPTRYFGRKLVIVPIAGGLLALWMLQRFGIIPHTPIGVGSLWYVLLMGLAVAGAWVWRAALRPTYIRMAPGVIQILEYRYGKPKPIIRSYPMDADTVAVVRGTATKKKTRDLTVTLTRRGRQDKIRFSFTRRQDNAVERMWQALLSTAPTPPLSNEELVG